MDLKTYQAYTMAEALAAVKRDLGADAVILNTRTSRRGGLMGIGRRTVIEVTAARSESGTGSAPDTAKSARRAVPAPIAVAPSRSSAPAARAYAAAQTSGTDAAAASADASDTRGEEGQVDLEFEKLKTRRLAQAMLERHERRQRDGQTSQNGASGPATSTRPSPTSPAVPGSASEPETSVLVAAADDGPAIRTVGRVARRFVLKPTTTPTGPDPGSRSGDDSFGRVENPAALASDPAGDSEEHPAVAATSVAAASPPMPAPIFETPHTVTPPRASSAARHEADLMRDELVAIRTMVGQVLQRQTTDTPGLPAPAMPQALFGQYLAMIGQELSTELADRIVHEVRGDLDDDMLDDEEIVRRAVRHRLASYIPTAECPVPEGSPDGRPLTIALVGPTGVGKTTTLAKLAASFKLRHGRSVALITSDTYRIAAVDQLRTYANIIGLRLEVVLTPPDMRQAVQSLSDVDVILIDTAGRSQNDADRIDDLKQFLVAGDPHEVHLVLSSTASEKVLMQEAEAFGQVGVDKVVLTKLDEAVSFGVLVNVVRRLGKELSFFTTGQEVPDHLEIGHAERLAELVMGADLQEPITA